MLIRTRGLRCRRRWWGSWLGWQGSEMLRGARCGSGYNPSHLTRFAMDAWRRSAKVWLVVIAVCVAGGPARGVAQSCGAKGLAVQVLGSGGPELQDKRASTSYLIWDHGRSRVIVDAGGGSALRFGESGAEMSPV